jgi:hypothetical protein
MALPFLYFLIQVFLIFPLIHGKPSLSELLYQNHEEYRDSTIIHRRFSPEELEDRLTRIGEPWEITRAGQSLEGRPIYSVRTGEGSTRVLLWSQMHGDEATATMAFLDLFRFFEASGDGFDPLRQRILSRLDIHFVPMLNPDGAARFIRRNALGIDLNRDALRLTSPEAQLLKALRDSLQPEWGFNMHDQRRFYGVGDQDRPVALAFLAPAFDEDRSLNEGREAAMKLIGGIVKDIQPFVGGYIARYNDAYERRAFGDNFQKWGTRTILVESGIIRGDWEKQELRRLNFVLLLSALDQIADGTWEEQSLRSYRRIPYNSRNAFFDLLLRNVTVRDRNGEPRKVDIGFRNQETGWDSIRGTTYEGRISDIGDLSMHYGHVDFEGAGYRIQSGKIYPRAFRNLADLMRSDPIPFLEKGYSVFQLQALPDPEKQSDLPFQLILPGEKPDYKLGLGRNPQFYLCQDDACSYYVQNGHLYRLDRDTGRLRQRVNP